MGSMAAPKSRVKYSIDPNVLNWAKNENKFGQKLMEKMGWTDGKGLGRNENGMTENIRVKVRSDNRGLGFDNKDYNNVWLDHQDDFDAVLKNLHESNGIKPKEEDTDEPKINTLEHKSQNRKRLHYGKLAKSKDLSSRSSTDIDLILGRHKRKEKKLHTQESYDSSEDTKAIQKLDKEGYSDEDSIRPSFALNHMQTNVPKSTKTTDKTSKSNDDDGDDLSRKLKFKTNPMSIGDYFAKKMSKGKRPEDEEQEKEEVAIENDCEEVLLEVVTSKVKKDKKKKRQEVEEAVQSDSELVPKKAKKSKKSKKSDHQEAECPILTEVKLKVSKQSEVLVAGQVENSEVAEENDVDKPINASSSFKGSNLSEIYGYSPYNITCSLDAILKDKEKRVNKKRVVMSKNLEIDAKFYEMAKKKNVS